MITKKTNTIGIIVPDISNAVFGKLTKGINSVFAQEGYTVVLCESQGELEKELKLLGILEEKQIEGLLFAGVDVNHTLVERMRKRNYPVVLVTQEASEDEEAVHTVIHNNMEAMYDAVKFLLDNGHERIAYLGGPKNDFSSGKKRVIGYKKALEEAGIEVKDSYIAQGDFSFEAGYQGMKKLYEENSKLPTAVVTGSDVIAVGAIQYLDNMRVKIPDDISIMGFDDSEFATYIKPELSTVRNSYYDEGVVDDAFTRRIPLMAWSPLGGGDVFKSTDEKFVRLRTVLTAIAEEHKTTIDAVIYAWLFVHPVRIAAITGTMNADRIQKAVDATELELSYDEWYQILEASRGYAVP